MPATIVITEVERQALEVAGIETQGSTFFTYKPKETLAIIEAVSAANAEGSQRLVARLSSLLGRHFTKRDPSPAPPIAEEVFAAPKRKRGMKDEDFDEIVAGLNEAIDMVKSKSPVEEQVEEIIDRLEQHDPDPEFVPEADEVDAHA